ncbi:unnamed protein product [Cylicocyclus nassatus]|uniref:Fucosyltransferase n=1 Tax=Cylicocyclus nassatus TaxID=53992 RepID=A0AA36DKC7_CYLNA|nr:unnamed protein product [Cylicocyclus nassatus]
MLREDIWDDIEGKVGFQRSGILEDEEDSVLATFPWLSTEARYETNYASAYRWQPTTQTSDGLKKLLTTVKRTAEQALDQADAAGGAETDDILMRKMKLRLLLSTKVTRSLPCIQSEKKAHQEISETCNLIVKNYKLRFGCFFNAALCATRPNNSRGANEEDSQGLPLGCQSEAVFAVDPPYSNLRLTSFECNCLPRLFADVELVVLPLCVTCVTRFSGCSSPCVAAGHCTFTPSLAPQQVPHDYFNATMTYRRDSRYHVPYGRFEPRSARDPTDRFYTEKQLHQAIKRKTKGSLLFISRCKTPSNRENIIRELGKFTDITARGKCEKLLTTNNYTGSAFCKSDCSDDALIATHRFYIAFENSVCKDYITEKFFDRISHLLVPVVLKRHIYEGADIPSDSFIAADDFGSLEDLGLYLNFLRQNDTAYLRYFEWTKHFRKPNVYQTKAFCKLCEDIHKRTKLSLNDIDKYLDAHECEQNAHYAKFWQMYTKPLRWRKPHHA